MREAILFFFGCSEVNSTWLSTTELANQRARKAVFTCVVYTKIIIYIKREGHGGRISARDNCNGARR